MATTNERELLELVEQVKENPLLPERWQALGKALGWYGNTCSRCRKLCGPNSLDSCNECGASGMYNQTWEHHALHWFELHLNNLITEKFWQDLLNPNRE